MRDLALFLAVMALTIGVLATIDPGASSPRPVWPDLTASGPDPPPPTAAPRVAPDASAGEPRHAPTLEGT